MLSQIQFSNHALQRMRERFLSKAIVYKAILKPQKLEQSQINPKRFIAKRVYYNDMLAKHHLLMVIYELEVSVIRVITIIDTSKVQKYL